MNIRNIIRFLLGLAVAVLLTLRIFYERHPVLTGETMGTAYSVTITGYVSRNEVPRLHEQIEDALADLNRQMSTWDAHSEITRFNQSGTNVPTQVSPEFARVVARAMEFGESTHWAFDPTLHPLLNLWGFGSGNEARTVPTDEAIAEAIAWTGPDMVWIEDATNLWKALPEVQLDLGAIAKGYGVDAIGRLLIEAGYGSWFVEIGGEVAVRGINRRGDPWRIGIQYPSSNPAVDRLQGILQLSDGAVATSGDYRNFIEEDGRIYSHILDPRFGYAVLSDTASVTVVAPDCMDADAVATALFVMGPDEGLTWVEDHPEAEAIFLVRSEEGEITERFSSGFVEATGYASEQQNNL
jgi:thiamine biosynthesis lipoprotein